MKLIWRPALFFVVCLIITLLINMPVGHLMVQVKIPNEIQISQIQGTLFEGQIDTVIVNQVFIQDFEYKFDSACLITASLCYQINFTDGSALIRFQPITGSIQASQVDIEFSMSNLGSVSDQFFIKPAGSLYLNSDKLEFMQGKLADIDAILVWKNAGIVGENINLGNYQVNIKKDTKQYQFKLVDKQAVLDVEGDGELKSDGKYSIDIAIIARPGLEARIKNALEFIGNKKGLNQYLIRYSGKSDKKLLSYLSF